MKTILIIISSFIIYNPVFSYELKLDSPDVWIVSKVKGLEKYDIRKNKFLEYNINREDHIEIISRNKETLFITKKGIKKLIHESKQVEDVKIENLEKQTEISSAYETPEGFYLGVRGAFLFYKYDENKWQKCEMPGDLKKLDVTGVFAIKENNLIFTDKNIFKYLKEAGEYRPVFNGNIRNVEYNNKEGSVYFLSDGVVKTIDENTIKAADIEIIKNMKFKRMWLESDDITKESYLFLTGNNNFIIYDLNTRSITDLTKEVLIKKLVKYKNGFKIDERVSINDVKIDSNKIRVATGGGGIIEITWEKDPKVRRWTVKDGLPSNFVNSIAIDEIRMFACFNDGLARHEKNKGSWDLIRSPSKIDLINDETSYNVPKIDQIKRIDKLSASDDHYGILSKGNIFVYFNNTAEWKHISNNAKDILIEKDILWFTTKNNEVIKYSLIAEKEEVIYQGDKTNIPVISIVSTKDHLYIGTANNLFRYDKEQKITLGIILNDILINKITYLADDHNFVWIGTSENGLIRYDCKKERVKVYKTKDGLISDTVSLIGIDNEYVWIKHGDNSISRMSKMTSYWDTYQEVTSYKSQVTSNKSRNVSQRSHLSAVAEVTSNESKNVSQGSKLPAAPLSNAEVDKSVFTVKRFIPNIVLDPSEKRWQIDKEWKILKETKGDRGGKWVEHEIDLQLDPSQIIRDSKSRWTWFVNKGELLKYDQINDTFTKTMPADLVSIYDNELIVSEGSSLNVILKN